ncbi:MAG: Csp1 family four helix bundle copper storage protein [Myxococcota bacterium]
MNRRKILVAGAAAAATQTVVAATGCKAEGGTTAAAHVGSGTEVSSFADAVGHCIEEGEICLTHCLRRLSEGDKSLGACAVRVREMLAVCGSTQTLALSQSSFLSAATALCVEVCDACRIECDKHAHHHDECRACADACRAVIAAAKSGA